MSLNKFSSVLVLRMTQDLRRLGNLNNLTAPHNCYSIRYFGQHRQLMCHEQYRDTQIFAQLTEYSE